MFKRPGDPKDWSILYSIPTALFSAGFIYSWMKGFHDLHQVRTKKKKIQNFFFSPSSGRLPHLLCLLRGGSRRPLLPNHRPPRQRDGYDGCGSRNAGHAEHSGCSDTSLCANRCFDGCWGRNRDRDCKKNGYYGFAAIGCSVS